MEHCPDCQSQAAGSHSALESDASACCCCSVRGLIASCVRTADHSLCAQACHSLEPLRQADLDGAMKLLPGKRTLIVAGQHPGLLPLAPFALHLQPAVQASRQLSLLRQAQARAARPDDAAAEL